MVALTVIQNVVVVAVIAFLVACWVTRNDKD